MSRPAPHLLSARSTPLSRAACSRVLRAARSPLTALGLCAIMLLGGCKDHYDSGLDALSEQRWEDAKLEARKGKASDIGDPRYDLLMAQAMVREAMALERAEEQANGMRAESPKARALYRDALPYAQSAYNSKKFDAPAGRVLGKIYWEQGNEDKAVEAWTRARAADPGSVADETYLTALLEALNKAMSGGYFERALSLRELLRTSVEADAKFASTLGEERAAEVESLLSEKSLRLNREQLAQSYVETRQYDEAIALYTQLASDYPEESTYHYQRGRYLLRTGKPAEASAAFDRYIEHPEKNERIARLRNVAKRAEQMGARSVSMQAYERLLKELPDTPSLERAPLYMKLAEINLDIGETKAARGFIRAYIEDLKALEKSALKASLYMTIVDKALHHNQPELAIELMEEALTEAPPSSRVMQKLANTYAYLARMGDAERVLRRYVERQNSSRESLVDAARWARGRNNFELSQHFYEKITARDDAKADDWLALARIYATQSRNDELRRALETYIELREGNRNAVNESAQIYMDQGLFEEAEGLLKKLQRKHPEDLAIADRFARLYSEDAWNKPGQMREVYLVWLKARGRKATDLQAVGDRFYNTGRYNEALPFLQEAAEKGEKGALLNIANIHIQERRNQQAGEALDRYLAQHAYRSAALGEVLNYYKRARMTEASIRTLEELIELEPRRDYHYQSLSELYLEQGRERDAFELWSRFLDNADDPYRALQKMSRFFDKRGREDWILNFYQQLLAKGRVDAKVFEIIGDTFDDLKQDLSARAAGQVTPEVEEARRKAEHYYTRFLQESAPKGSKLGSFAGRMRNKGYTVLAARAYKQLIDASSSPAPKLWKEYGEMLLSTGETEQGELAIERYYQASGGSDKAAETAGILLANARRYEAAEPYLQRVVASKDSGLQRKGFERLADIYRQSDRQDELRGLIRQYLQNSQNGARSREHVQNVAISTGMWDVAIEQLEVQSVAKDANQRFVIGGMQWRLGKEEDARKTWSEWASGSEQPDVAWLQVANFYEAHARPELAMQAYQQAVKSQPESWRALAELAHLQLLQGLIPEGMQGYAQAVEKAPSSNKEQLYSLQLQTLQEMGQTHLLRQVARDALKINGVDKIRFLDPLARAAFESGDPIQVDRMLGELKASGITLDRVVPLLAAYGFLEQAAQRIEEEIAVGDYITAGDVLVQNADIFTRLGGIDYLMRAIQPLLDRSRPNALLEGSLGEFLAREGHLERGALFLKIANDQGHTQWRLLLAQTNLQLGNEHEAQRLFLESLLSTRSQEREAMLRDITARHIIAQKPKQMRLLLEHLMRDERFIAAAAPLLFNTMIEDGDVLAVFSLVRNFMHGENRVVSAEAALVLQDTVSGAQHRQVFLSGVSTLAAHGYTAEARSLLEGVSQETEQMEAYQELRLKLDTLQSNPDVEPALSAFVDVSKNATKARRMSNLELAKILMIADQHAPARKLALQELGASDDDLALAAITLLMQSAFITNEPKLQQQWSEQFLKSQPDKQGMRAHVGGLRARFAQDRESMELMAQNARNMPTPNNIRRVYWKAQELGDPGLASDYSDAYWHVISNPMDEVVRQVHLYQRSTPEMLEPLFEPVLRVHPMRAAVRYERAKMYFRLGQVEKGRAILKAHLEASGGHALILEDLVAEMVDARLWSEARALGAQLDGAHYSPRMHLLLGFAEAGLGRLEQARVHLDAYLLTHHDPGWAALEVTKYLDFQSSHVLALEYAEQAVRKHPTRPEAYHWRGLMRLVNADLAGARPDLERSISEGIGRTTGIYRIIDAALAQDQDAYAREMMMSMASVPSGQLSPTETFRFALSAWSKRGKAGAALKLLEEEFPEMLSTSTLAPMMGSNIVGIYEDAGMPEQSFKLYDYMIREQFLRDKTNETSNSNVTNWNNLAYLFSTSNMRVQEGEVLVRRAMALSANREPSYIDTLGWLYWRQGRLPEAEAEIRRALRSSTQSPASLIELYEHLAELREAQGFHEESVWLRIYVEGFK